MFLPHTVRRLAAVLTLAAALALPAQAVPGPQLATFVCDITPPEGHPLCGGWIKPLEGMDDPLLAKGIVLRDPGGTYVLCVLDWCTLRNNAYELFRGKIAAAAGTDPARVAVHCLHPHNAPITDLRAQELLDSVPDAPTHADLAFLEKAASDVAAAAGCAAQRLRPVTHVGAGAAKVERVASSRRLKADDGSIRMRFSSTGDPELHAAPEGLIDPWLRTVSFHNGGEALAYMHTYATHPQSTYGDGRATYDFPGIARERLEQETGVFQLHFTGCAGDVAAGKYNDGTPPRRAELAERMHAAMVRSIAAISLQPAAPITWRVRPVRFPTREGPQYGEAQNRQRLQDTTLAPQSRIHAALTLAWLERFREDRPFEPTCLGMGSIRILHLPGEPFVTFQVEAQQRRPDLFVAAAGYADCGMGYICTELSYQEGGYEPTASLLAPAAEHYFRAAIADLLADDPAPRPVVRAVTRIWDAAPHSAFTDLIRFRGRWYCTFREGAGHVSPEGVIRILSSEDGTDWTSEALLGEKHVDLRDPKLSVTPGGQLMLLCGRRTWPPLVQTLQSCVAFSEDGKAWTAPATILQEGLWLWRVTWHEGIGYGIAYRGAEPRTSHLYRTQDGIAYEKLADFDAYPGLTEATLRFGEDGTLYCLHRRDGASNSALLGTSTHPFTEWQWRNSGFYFGGPNFLRRGDAWWAAGRWMAGPARTVIARADWTAGTLEPVLTLPSGGDTSYPGMVIHDDELWISYYASHEGKSAIYLARVAFE